MESIGRSFGTERPSISPFLRHVDRQTETGNPVDRLATEVDAGGRRRTRKANQNESRREQGGQRPEDLRAERQEAGSTSRRRSEAQGREAAAERRDTQRLASSSSSVEPASSRTSESTPRSGASDETFGNQLRSKIALQQAGAATSSVAPESVETEAQVQLPSIALPAPTLSGNSVTASATSTSTASASAPTSARSQPAAATPISLETGTKEARAEKRDTPARFESQGASDTHESERAAQVLKQFRMHLHPGLRTATLQLSPADLGRLSIRIRVDGERVHALVRAESAESLQALERHVPELEAAFADQGFGEVALEFGLSSDGGDQEMSTEGLLDTSSRLTPLVESEINPDHRALADSSVIGVDTYA